MHHHTHLLNKIQSKEATICIIGLGYVGLPLASVFHDQGFHVIGLDVDEKKIDHLSKGQSYIHHIPHTSIELFLKSGRFIASSDFAQIGHADVIIMKRFITEPV